GLQNPVRYGALGARALVLEQSVGRARVDPEEHMVAPRECVGADGAKARAREAYEAGLLVVVVSQLPADFPARAGGQRIRRRALSERRRRRRQQDRRTSENFRHELLPYPCGLTSLRYCAMCLSACLGLPSDLHSSARL